jgi:hypothetical protein
MPGVSTFVTRVFPSGPVRGNGQFFRRFGEELDRKSNWFNLPCRACLKIDCWNPRTSIPLHEQFPKFWNVFSISGQPDIATARHLDQRYLAFRSFGVHLELSAGEAKLLQEALTYQPLTPSGALSFPSDCSTLLSVPLQLPHPTRIPLGFTEAAGGYSHAATSGNFSNALARPSPFVSPRQA